MARKSKETIEREALERIDEINAAAEDRVKAMMPGILAELTKTLLAAKTNDGQAPTVSAQDTTWMQGLATAIVGAADPRNKNRSVDPAVMAARKDAHKRMIALLTKAHAEGGEKPIYLVKVKMFLDNTKIDPEWRDASKQFHATKIAWDRIPNQGMLPQNDLAKEVFAEFERSIGTVSAEGVPDAPWMNPGSPWVQTAEGIVLGRPLMDVPEIAQAAGGAKIFNDPRVAGLPGEGRKETRVFGTIAPAVVEVAGI